ncbi:MAG TPA: amidohydrolase family protein [Pyrinomonadaceae bacterium]|jgi:imidazolonepropionase-like amidohydrolase|nr:amidohydrolase family protein [Pyrinomonadaceae bacterium]
MLKHHSRHAALLLACLLTACVAQRLFIAHAQRNAIDTYAITNARIYTLNGPIIERGTIVIRNGLIKAVGASVNAPPDARVIDGAGLTIYPGLIDSYTSLGMPQPSPSPTGRAGAAARAAQTSQTAPAFSAPNSSQPPGLQPEVLAESLIQPGEAGIEAERNAGITSALTAPREGIFMGQSAFINLNGETTQQMILRSPVAMHVAFTPLRTGSYPNSLMGVFAALRQMLLDAQRYQTAQAVYERAPRGLRRPEQDRSLAALMPVINREMPVVMYANTEREIRRALDLAQEFNLRVIIAGGAESWKVAERLRQQDVPVLLSLNFPRRTTAQVPEADPDPLRVLRERVDAPKTAGRLAAAHVNFAFQSGAMPNMTEFLSNVSKAIDNGLARDEALRALTIRPAEILGVANQLGTIEAGKIANLTVTRGDIFDRNARISQVFIDGRPVDLKPVTQTAGAGAGLATGTWTLNVNLGEGDLNATLILQQEGDRLRGSLQGALGTAQISNASVSSSGEISFTAPVNIGGQTTEANFAGTITGNEMRGTMQIVGRSPGTFTGTRPVGPSVTPTPARAPNTPQSTPANQPPSSNQTPSHAPGTSTSNNVAPDNVADLSGDWALKIVFGPNTVPGTLTLHQQGATLTGTLQSPFGTTELSNGSTGPDGFRFTTTANVQGRIVEITVTGTASGNEMSGMVASEIGSTAFTGTRPQKQ